MSAEKVADNQYVECVVEAVHKAPGGGWDIRIDEGAHFWIPEKGVEPEVGDTVRFYGRGLFFPVRGVDLNGVEVFYETESEYQTRVEGERQEEDRVKREQFRQNLPRWLERVQTLPTLFQERINGFRERNPDWEWEFGNYELFCCEQAVVLASALETPAAIQQFRRLSPTARRARVPALLSDQHSGNTFGAACVLAEVFLEQPEWIPKVHGALCPLTGCAEYGCWSTTPVPGADRHDPEGEDSL